MVFSTEIWKEGKVGEKREAMKLATCESQTMYRDQLWCEEVSEQPGSF